jgi:3alpha(or 20beta)-hydroxysteroid dehydrogenase
VTDATRTVIVTGATRGLGAAVARHFAADGAHVVVCGRDQEAGLALVESLAGSHRFQILDVREPAAWERVVAETMEEFGTPDVLVNNAGVMRVAPITDMSVEDIQMVIDINVLGPLLGMRFVGEVMAAAGRGVIINVSSTAGIAAAPRLAVYGASKWALRGATKAAAADFGPDGVRVISLHPGATATEMLARSGLSNEEIVMRHGDQLLIKRVADPAEIARIVAMLASDDAGYMTGTEFIVDGGVTANQM